MKIYNRGYKNGVKIVEIVDGNLDVVLYNEKKTSFYFYRFDPEAILGREFHNMATVINQKEMRNLLVECGKIDYDGFVNELIMTAVESGMNQRYEM